MKESQSAYASGNVNVCGVDVGKLDRWPDQLRGVDLDGSEHARDQADQHGGVKNIFSRVLGFFRKSRDAVEADVSQYRDRGTMKHRRRREGGRIVKGPRESGKRVVGGMQNVSECRGENDDD